MSTERASAAFESESLKDTMVLPRIARPPLGSQAVESTRAREDPERGRQRHDPKGQRVARRVQGARRLRVQEC